MRHSSKGTDQDDHLSHLTSQPWRRMLPHGTTTTAPANTSPLGTIHRYPQHPRRPDIRACTGHLVGAYQRLWPDDTDRDQDHRPGLLSQKSGIRRGVTADEHENGGWRAGGSVPGCPGPTPGLERRVSALPRDKHGELQGHHQKKTDPDHWRIPPTLHLVTLTVIG